MRWTSYAIAAGATAVAGTPTAEAEIHYSGPINFKFESRLSETHSFPLSQGAVLVGIREEVGFYEHDAYFKVQGAAVSNELREYPLTSSFPYSNSLVAALPRGSVVSQGYFGALVLGASNTIIAVGRTGLNPAPTLSAFASTAAVVCNMAGCGSSGTVAPRTNL